MFGLAVAIPSSANDNCNEAMGRDPAAHILSSGDHGSPKEELSPHSSFLSWPESQVEKALRDLAQEVDPQKHRRGGGAEPQYFISSVLGSSSSVRFGEGVFFCFWRR